MRSYSIATTSRIALALLVLAVLLGLLLPVYSDEVAWRATARAAIDGVDRPLFANCGPNTLAVPPAFILAVRTVSAAVNLALADPIYVRLAGVFWALAWLGLLVLLIRIIARSAHERATLTLVATALLSLGTLPLLLVLSRPEQPVLLALTTSILIVIVQHRGEHRPSVRRSAAAALGIVLLAALALAYHLKGVAYLPVFIACALLSSQGRVGRIARWGSAAALVVLGAVAARYWIDRFQCPNDAMIAKMLAAYSLAAGTLDADVLLRQAAAAINPLNYVGLIVPTAESEANWLPPVPLSRLAELFLAIAILCAWGAGIALAAACLFRSVTSQRGEAFSMRLVALGVTIIAVLAVWSFTQLVRNFYEAALFLPMLVITMMLLMRSANLSEHHLRRIGRAATATAALALFSQITVAAIYLPSLWGSARQAGYIAAQPMSTSAFGFATLEKQIIRTGKMCGIDPARRLNALMIDDLTYLTYMRSYRPLHHQAVVSVWNGEIGDSLTYLKQQKSSGAVLACKYLSPSMRARAKQSGDFCCLGLADLEQ